MLFDNNHIEIEGLYNIISLYKVKSSSKNKLPDEIYKYLKSAIKLEKDIENITKIVIDEIEKENFNSSNIKQLEFVCDSIKKSNENTTNYYNIKHIQVR